MVIAARADVLERLGLVVVLLRVDAVEDEAFHFIGGVECVAVFFELLLGVALQHRAHVGDVGRAVFVDHFAEHQHLAGSKDVGRRPVERSPVDAEAKIAFALRREAAN